MGYSFHYAAAGGGDRAVVGPHPSWGCNRGVLWVWVFILNPASSAFTSYLLISLFLAALDEAHPWRPLKCYLPIITVVYLVQVWPNSTTWPWYRAWFLPALLLKRPRCCINCQEALLAHELGTPWLGSRLELPVEDHMAASVKPTNITSCTRVCKATCDVASGCESGKARLLATAEWRAALHCTQAGLCQPSDVHLSCLQAKLRMCPEALGRLQPSRFRAGCDAIPLNALKIYHHA